MTLVFWISVAAIAYVYAGYPLVLLFWARLRPKPAIHCGLRMADGGLIVDGGSRHADSGFTAQSIRHPHSAIRNTASRSTACRS
jgi:hypothetical protein